MNRRNRWQLYLLPAACFAFLTISFATKRDWLSVAIMALGTSLQLFMAWLVWRSTRRPVS